MMLSSLVTSRFSLTRPLRMLINTNKLKYESLISSSLSNYGLEYKSSLFIGH